VKPKDIGIKPVRFPLRFHVRAGLLLVRELVWGQAVAIREFSVLAPSVVAVGRETACEDDLDLQEQDPVTKD
jgi:hypothetical protein